MALDYKTEYQRYRHYFTYLKPIIEDPVTRAYFSAVASIITIAVFIAFAIRPTIATIFTLNREIGDKTSLSAQLDAKISALSALTSDYQAIEEFLPLVDLALPDSPDLSLALSSLDKSALASKVKIENIVGGKVNYQQVATGSAIAVPLIVSLSGDYSGFQTFLGLLGNLPRLVTVSDLTLAVKTASLTINLYYYP